MVVVHGLRGTLHGTSTVGIDPAVGVPERDAQPAAPPKIEQARQARQTRAAAPDEFPHEVRRDHVDLRVCRTSRSRSGVRLPE